MRLALALAVAALALALVVGPAASAAGGPTRVLVADRPALHSSEPLKEWTGKRPSLADVDGDGDLEIIAQNENARVYVIDARTGRALVEVKPFYPYGPDLGPFNGPKAADLDGDGTVELVNVNRAAVLSVWSLEKHGEKLSPKLRWEKHLKQFHGLPSADAGPVLGDLDGDGDLEIVVQTEETGSFAFHHDGKTHWALKEFGGNAEAKLADVDGNGGLDAVFFTDGGRVYAVDGPSGRILWKFESRRHGVWPGSAASPGVVDDLDGDGRVEVVFCARNVENATEEYAPGRPTYRSHHFVLFGLRDGKLLWKVKPPWGAPLCSAYLMAHDADGDGEKEIYGMDWNTIGHKPGNWERTGSHHAFAFTAGGREIWHKALDHFGAKMAIALADWNGDGKQDVVAYGSHELAILDARTGSRLSTLRLGDWDVKQGPLFADLTGDGTLEVVIGAQDRSNAFLVYRLGERVAPAWPGWELPTPDPPGEPPPPPAPAPPAEDPPAEGGPDGASPGARPGDGLAPTGDPEETAGPLSDGKAIPAPAAALAVAAAIAARAVGRRRSRGP